MYRHPPVTNRWPYGAAALLGLLVTLAVLLAAAAPTAALANQQQTNGDQAAVVEPDPKTAEQESVQGDVEAQAQEQADEQRRTLVDEAIAAVQMTNNALNLLSEEEPNADDAIAELEKAVGKLELLVARNPALATIPVAVSTQTLDVIALPETVEALVDEAEKAVDDGEVQKARRILDGLASEFVVSTTRLPLATYPDAIRDAVPLIDQGNVDEAKAQLGAALNLLVVDSVIYPLPLMRAEAMLAEAEALAEKDDREESENERLANLLDAARDELKFGRILGYYSTDDVEPLYEQIEQIEGKTEGGQYGTGYFDRLKRMVSDLF